ncbi:hypothetical protein D9613_001159 [Agrocybe pediades]|uniref:Uncharacterized protein n=1 Tax=Agrocybe pediades TaxID=84607 RepID=A0A8H4VSF6_9AGAR|nr:hypothetical protein D9613_001159 [Agrocybe pediades]
MTFPFFKREHRKRAADSTTGCIRTSKPPAKLQKLVRRTRQTEGHQIPKAQATSVPSQKRGTGSSGPPQSFGISDLVLDPYQYTALLLQASSQRDNQSKPNFVERPTTPAPDGTLPSGDLAAVKAPPSTPVARMQGRRREDNSSYESSSSAFTASSESAHQTQREAEFDRAIVEGVTYDAILASTLHRTLGQVVSDSEENDFLPPETRVPPNSPVGYFGRYTSLVGASMAIMENRIQ